MELLENQREIDTLKKKTGGEGEPHQAPGEEIKVKFCLLRGNKKVFLLSPVLNVPISFETDLRAPCRRALKGPASRQQGGYTHVKGSENTRSVGAQQNARLQTKTVIYYNLHLNRI